MPRTLATLGVIALMVCFGDLDAVFSQQPDEPLSPSAIKERLRGITFEKFALSYDANEDWQVSRDEYKGDPQLFRALDRDNNGVITQPEWVAAKRGGSLDHVARRREPPEGVTAFRDLEYAEVDGQSLKLDLYVPEDTEPKPPLLVWIHGGGWFQGDKSEFNPMFLRLTAQGYAAASIDYRLTFLNSHPDQIHDCKGAIRWLRANAEEYGYDATRICVGGGSAGGHLALLLGMSGGVEELEGVVGGNLDQSSRVQAIVDIYGPTALDLYAEMSPKFARNKSPELIRSACPLTHLDKDDPPVIIFHGDQDLTAPVELSEAFHRQCQETGAESTLYILEGAGHGGAQFSDPERYDLVKAFVDRHIKQTGGALNGEALNPDAPAETPPAATDTQSTPGPDSPLRGLYWMAGMGRAGSYTDSRFQTFLTNFERNLANNQFISGVYLDSKWKDINPQEGVYKLERLDALVALIKKYELSYLLIMYPGTATPEFVYEDGCVPFKAIGTNIRRESFGQEVSIPLPWDAVYRKHYYRMISKLADRYGADTELVAIGAVPYSYNASELHLPRTRSDIEQWEEYPRYKERLVTEAQYAIDRFAELFPRQQLAFTLGMLVGGQNSEPELRSIIEYGYSKYPQRFSIQSDQLHGQFDNSGMFTYDLIMDYRDSGHNGFQSLAGWTYEQSAERQGSMELSVYNYLRTGAEYWQLWFGDGASIDMCGRLTAILAEAEAMGHEAYLEKLKREGKYRPFRSPNQRNN